MIKVVRGNPTPEELAAVVAVLSFTGGQGPAPSPRRPSAWASPARLLRAPQVPGPTGWLASALPC
ncbi:acyl-CoA carboxylase subunit epsilon [Streptomyces sp. NPDC058001]|uniref:acyl-CoA carboxylase subunit epsilon n=1 Tax=Streptomyces sp. NPDC058001 TaxID=3346300 RepID=UPI0036E97243